MGAQFGIVAAGETVDRRAIAGQRQRAGGEPFHIERRIPGVGDGGGHYQAIAVERDPLLHRQPRDRIGQPHGDRGGIGGDGRAVEPLGEGKPAAMRAKRGRAEPAGAEGGHERERLIGVQREGGGRADGGQRRQAGRFHPRPPPAQQRRAGGAFQHQARRRAMQSEDVAHAFARPAVRPSRTVRTLAAARIIRMPDKVSTWRGSPCISGP